MQKMNQLLTLANQCSGVIQTAQAQNLGVSKSYFYQFVKEYDFRQVAHGIYLSPEAWEDGMYFLHLRSAQAVFSHESALFLHDLTDREPLQYNVTVKTGYNPTRLTADGVKVYSIKPSLHSLGMSEAKTSFGRLVPCYNMERTICDILRSRSGVEIQTMQEALKSYVRRRDKNLRELTQYAETLRVENVLRPYLEVLL